MNGGQLERNVFALSAFSQIWVFMREIKESPQGVIWKQSKVTSTINRLLYLVMKTFSQACSWVITKLYSNISFFFYWKEEHKTNQDLEKQLGDSPWAIDVIPGTLKYKKWLVNDLSQELYLGDGCALFWSQKSLEKLDMR